MHTLLTAIALVGLNFLGGNLSGEEARGVSDASMITLVSFQEMEQVSETITIEMETKETVSDEFLIPDSRDAEEIQKEEEVTIRTEERVREPIETEIIEVEIIKEELTYDQLTQRDGGDSIPEPLPPEVVASWYVEETAAEGLQMILESYSIQEFSFVLDSCPSNYVYQYEFYLDSPDKEHVNLIGVFQYDATGNRTFQMDPINGTWE